MKSLKLQRGMSLVELLVALAIGAFLIIGAVTVQSQTRKTSSVNEQQARLQETARFVLSVIEPDVQLAGLYGFSNIPDGVRMSVKGNYQYASDMRTYCMVRVDAPCWDLPPALLLLTNARATPLRSTPLCLKNSWSSAATMAFCMFFEMSFSGTSLRNSS